MIEPARDQSHSITDSLIGNFPIQRFSSVGSFLKVKKSNQSLLVIIDDSCVPQEHGDKIKFQNFLKSSASTVLFVGQKSHLNWVEFRNFGINCDKYLDSAHHLDFYFAVKCFLETSGNHAEDLVFYKDLKFNFSDLELFVVPEKTARSLTTKEGKLLKLLIRYPNKMIARGLIQSGVWGNVSVSPRTLDSQVSRLRKRMEGSEVRIENIYGDGYVLK